MENKIPTTVGLLAHVDAGKTTLSEALLYVAGVRRTLGRVDHRDAYLDTHNLERARGITIFSKQAQLPEQHITLLDTPGHVDFAPEAERVMPVLSCAVLVISGTDGVQAHTLTLWQLLRRYAVPTFLFLNKMDLPGKGREELMQELQEAFGSGFVDFTQPQETIWENAALCDEALLETYLETGTVTQGNLRERIAHGKLFPCCFGSGLKLQGVDTLLELLTTYAPREEYGQEFAAKVYKISRDPQGNRLTWLKVTGGSLSVRTALSYETAKGDKVEEKIQQLRIYSGEKFTAVQQVLPGQICAATGLSQTWIGQSLGAEPEGKPPLVEPVMSYRIALPSGTDPMTVLPKLRQLEEEDPTLHILWEAGQIHAQVMGKVQQEILKSLIHQRFSLEVQLTDPKIHYRETIENTVEGVGHFEPLRHYAEVHLLLEPLPQGSGLVFDTRCPLDVLDVNYQKLILTHLQEKTHKGVLTGAPITDMKITLLLGKAHLKHTEGGDFRQATYRAVRQGLMEAKPKLLEPWYRFTLIVPSNQVGRAITDIRAMGGLPEPPENRRENAILTGQVPASELGDYAQQVAAYTQGKGQLQLSLLGYAPCHNQEAVVAAADYNPEADLENTPDSVFCAHGAGFTVKWNQVKDYMHLESGLQEEKPPELVTRNLRVDDKELEAIMLREFGPMKRPLYRPPENRPAKEEIFIRPPQQRCLIVDGYNMIFAWDGLSATARTDLDAARRQLLDRLSSYTGYTKCRTVVVFDGYKVAGNPGEKGHFHNLQVVYTKENQTADAYIQSLVREIGKNYQVRVATSDALVQLSSLGSGVLRMSARELEEEVARTAKEMQAHFHAE